MPTPRSTVDPTALVVGASRGLGRGIALALAGAGLPVIAVARSAPALAELRASGGVETVVADAADPSVAPRLLDGQRPQALILVAGATPVMLPLPQQTWETFSRNWEADVRITFQWLTGALSRPLAPGSRVIVISSGAALNGSPLSGGYAGAKATQRFLTAYARDEAARAGLEIAFTAVLPRITPHTELGRPAIRAYAARNGQTEQEYLAAFGPALTPEIAGAAMLELVWAPAAELAPEYLLAGAGLKPLPS